MAKNKHLTDGERLQIEQWLKERISIKQIACSSKTISLSPDMLCKQLTLPAFRVMIYLLSNEVNIFSQDT